jgi:3-hydroxyisobutyrate dehydrogenase-like beta-hydroxyacid dehydrogenase
LYLHEGKQFSGKTEGGIMRIGFVGLGLMGSAMAERLLRAGFPLNVHNRTEERAKPLLELGASWCSSPDETAASSDVVFSMLSDPPALEEVSRAIIAGLKPGGIHVDCSTVAPELTRRLDSEYRQHGVTFMHVPVLGSVSQVKEGTLLLFAGGSNDGFSRIQPLLNVLGKRIWRFERPEQATMVKLICNSFIAGLILVLDQGLMLARDNGVDQRTLLDIIGQSSLAAPMFETKGATTIAGNFAPRFFLGHMLKDIRLALAAGRASGTPVPVAELADELFTRAAKMGLGNEDYSAVIKELHQEV